MTPSRTRRSDIDGLRGVAALCVVIFHAVVFSPYRDGLYTTLTDTVWRGHAELGAIGVEVFFLLSGYVLTLSLIREPLDRDSARRFIVRRQLRLDPPYWFALVITLVISMSQALVPGLTTNSYSPLDVVANAFYLQGILGRPAVVEVAWTLCIEVQLYLALLVALSACRWLTQRAHDATRQFTRAAGYLLTAVAVGTMLLYEGGHGRSIVWLLPALPLFCIGALLHLADRSAFPRAIPWLLFLANLALRATWWSVGPLAIAFIVLAAASPLRQVFAARPLVWLGVRSYSLYLIHAPVVHVVSRPIYKLTGDSASIGYLTSVLAAVCALVAAAIMFRMVEQPSLALANVFRSGGAAGLRSAVREQITRRPQPAVSPPAEA